MLHLEDFIEIYCLSNYKTPRGMAERESSTLTVFAVLKGIVLFYIVNLYRNKVFAMAVKSYILPLLGYIIFLVAFIILLSNSALRF